MINFLNFLVIQKHHKRFFFFILEKAQQFVSLIFQGIIFGIKFGIGIYRSLSAGGLPVCRFYPCCSQYAQQSLQRHGIKGVKFILKRFIKCHPWGEMGYDPVPEKDNTINYFLKNTHSIFEFSINTECIQKNHLPYRQIHD